jgi:hypothetical protein
MKYVSKSNHTVADTAKALMACGLCGAVSLMTQPVLAQDTSNDWRFAAAVYGWFPDIGGHTDLPAGSTSIDVDIGTILDHLKMTGQGSFELQKGRWGAFTDVVYLDVGDTKSQTRNVEIGGVPLPATVTGKVDFDLKSLFWTLAGTYQLGSNPDAPCLFLFGARLASFDQDIDWEFTGDFGSITPPPRTGNRGTSVDQWDAIVGLRGQFKLGADGHWAIPYHFDIGTGDSDLTSQAMLGLSYVFGWGDISVAWRYLDYDLKSGGPIKDMDFSGPAAGLKFRW